MQFSQRPVLIVIVVGVSMSSVLIKIGELPWQLIVKIVCFFNLLLSHLMVHILSWKNNLIS
uniref:Uncharacterized protein n=1 Tax=Strongyloides papillosus TaxID=174720 RepID=A0A0N5C8F4_STREA